VALWCAALVTITGLLALIGVLYFTQKNIEDNSPLLPLSGYSEDPVVLRSENFALIEQNRLSVEHSVDDMRRNGLIGLGIIAALSLVAGWLVAGRMLRPATRLAEAAEDITALNLDQRFATIGPDDELKSIADSFNGMLDRLDNAFERQQRFVADASHELRTPFATMRAQVDVALDDEQMSEEELRASLEEVGQVLDRGSDLVNAMLTLSRAETLTRLEKLDLAEIAGEALTASPGIGRLELVAELESSAILGDPVLIGQLVSNLIDNASRHNIDGGLLSVKVWNQGTTATLEVVNDGTKLNEDEVRSLFIRFHRHDSARHTQGFGLGLSVVEAIAKAHGGRITADPRPEGGLQVRFEIPVETERLRTPGSGIG
jgi:signal transduction histidine kinase